MSEGPEAVSGHIEQRWLPRQFHVARRSASPLLVSGYVWRGLGLHHRGWGAPRAQTRWSLIHLGSGGCFLRFIGDVATVFPVAGEIARCSDFTLFDLPDGWRQTDPALPAKIGAICQAHPEAFPDSQFAGWEVLDEEARAVIDARAGR